MKLFPKTALTIIPAFAIALILINGTAMEVLSDVDVAPNAAGKTQPHALPENLDAKAISQESGRSPLSKPQRIPPHEHQETAITLVSAGVFVMLLTGLLFMAIKWLVIKPINRLQKASEEVANGNFNVTLATGSRDEISALARSFLIMCKNLKSATEKAHKLAYYDEVTGLPNRRSYQSDIHKITLGARNSNPCAVVLMDLDHFKEVNDVYGHAMGDRLLIEVSKRLTEQSKKFAEEIDQRIQAAVYRIAGDEFIVLLTNLNKVSIAIDVAHKLQESMEMPVLVGNQSFRAKCSMGVSFYPLHSIEADSLFQYADMAMYEAKKQGRGRCCVFDETFLNRILVETDMEKDIRSAIKNEDFYLVFQPKYSVKSKTATEFEALIRWCHPEKGMISPGVFIPFAEDRNMINEIGIWVIDKLCQTIREMEHTGWSEFRISFNTSPKQLQNIAFIRHLQNCIERYGINPEHLEMEITEHSIASDFEKTIKALEHVRNMGLQISIDDFGTGYSSLSYLRRMPINTIKIDKIFISEALKNSKSRTVVETILTLANGLGMKTVAEGVESLDEFKYVTEQGCDYVQGYFFSKPVGFKELEKYRDKRQEIPLESSRQVAI